jgi:tellurite methyltransferase
MEHVFNKKSVDFFESQFQRQVRDQEYALNPFEILALDYVTAQSWILGVGLAT